MNKIESPEKSLFNRGGRRERGVFLWKFLLSASSAPSAVSFFSGLKIGYTEETDFTNAADKSV